MEVSRIISEIDEQIAKLQQARSLLLGTTVRAPGRPKGSRNAAPRKRKLTAAGRKRISEAMKKRWEEQRKKAAKKS